MSSGRTRWRRRGPNTLSSLQGAGATAGFVVPSFQRGFRFLGLTGLQSQEATQNIHEAAGITSRWLSICSGEPRCAGVLATVSDDSRPQTLCDPGFITDDVSRLHCVRHFQHSGSASARYPPNCGPAIISTSSQQRASAAPQSHSQESVPV